MSPQTFEEYMHAFDQRVGAYIPPRSQWTPVDEALYGPTDLYRVPEAEAEGLLLRSIRYSFDCHYHHNRVYHQYCVDHGISPDDIRTIEDLEKIPLLPDRFFKNYPGGRDFATWLANLITGEVPPVKIKQTEPTFDQVVRAFNEAGMVIAYSSGTSGRHTVIPRDRRTFLATEYAISKGVVAMAYPYYDYNIHGYLVMPNPRKTNVFAGKVCSIYFDAIKDVRVAIDREVSADVVRITMSNEKGLRNSVIRFVSRLTTKRMISAIIRWLEQQEKSDEMVAILGAPFLIKTVMDRLEAQGRSFNFDGRGGIFTGGGWKVYEDNRLPAETFRAQAKRVLGIRDELCGDLYGMVEGNGWMTQCPEGHYLHMPTTYYRGMVLGPDLKPLPFGETGRFAFLDAAAMSYPGFIITGDMVKMLPHCPVCDRPGPVLEPEVRRATGEDIRGCGEEVRRMLTADMGG